MGQKQKKDIVGVAIYLERDATSNNDHCKLQNVIKSRNAIACKKHKIWYKTKVKCDI